MGHHFGDSICISCICQQYQLNMGHILHARNYQPICNTTSVSDHLVPLHFAWRYYRYMIRMYVRLLSCITTEGGTYMYNVKEWFTLQAVWWD